MSVDLIARAMAASAMGGGGPTPPAPGGITVDLLWENAKPKDGFAPQYITLDISEYDYLLIDFSGFESTIPAHSITALIQITDGFEVQSVPLINISDNAHNGVNCGCWNIVVKRSGNDNILFSQRVTYIIKENNTISNYYYQTSARFNPYHIYGIKL